MTTSNDSFFQQTAAEIFRDALYLCDALEEGEPITGEHQSACMRALNRMLKSWQADAGHRWLKTEGALFLDGRRSYRIGHQTVIDRAAMGDFGVSTTAATVATGTVRIRPLDSTGVEVGNTIGVERDDGLFHWDTVAEIDGLTVVLTDGLSFAASGGARVFWFAKQVERPLRITHARRGTFDGAEIPCDVVDRPEYMDQPNKDSTGQPVMVHYSPQRDYGEFFVWPKGEVGTVLRFTYERPLEQVTSVSQTLDWPSEWLDAITLGLAYRVGAQYGATSQKLMELKMEASEMKEALLVWDQPDGSIIIQPQRGG